MKAVKVLIVDDSASKRLLLNHVLELDPRIKVVATVNDGQAAIDFLAAATARPDVVVMDIHMPKLDGFEATRRIMETRPLPIVICTATADPQELQVAFRAMEAGAVACVEKPVGYDHPQFEAVVQNLQQTVRLMAEVVVVRRWVRSRRAERAPVGVPAQHSHGSPGGRSGAPRIVALGASTGGPPILQSILGALPRDFPAPILIVQHIARGFLPGMVEWLNQTTGMQVHIAVHGTLPAPGNVYIAPDDFHLGVGASGRLSLSHEPAEGGLRPSVSYLFRSIAESFGEGAVGVLLTGMGRDGAAELKLMRERGALTIAQDRESSVVHGMPGAAIELDAAMQVLPADRIAGALVAGLERRIPQAGGAEV
jgi:two-component system chemotaxis response regulator CheB